MLSSDSKPYVKRMITAKKPPDDTVRWLCHSVESERPLVPRGAHAVTPFTTLKAWLTRPVRQSVRFLQLMRCNASIDRAE